MNIELFNRQKKNSLQFMCQFLSSYSDLTETQQFLIRKQLQINYNKKIFRTKRLINQSNPSIKLLMSYQICISLQKITFPCFLVQKQNSYFDIHIISDACFQKLIPKRKNKNNSINLFGQKMFITSKTKEILFDVTFSYNSEQKNQNKRLCCFYYEIQELSAINKKKILKSLNYLDKNYHNLQFQLHITGKKNLQIDTDTNINNVTQYNFSQSKTPMNEISNFFPQITNKIHPKQPQYRVFSPHNISSSRKIIFQKQLFSSQQNNWQIKSQYSPTKKTFFQFQEENNKENSSKNYSESIRHPNYNMLKCNKNPETLQSPIQHCQNLSQQQKLQTLQPKNTFQTQSFIQQSPKQQFQSHQNYKKNSFINANANYSYIFNLPNNTKILTQGLNMQFSNSSSDIMMKNQIDHVNTTMDYERKVSLEDMLQDEKGYKGYGGKRENVQNENFKKDNNNRLKYYYSFFSGIQSKIMIGIGGLIGISCAWLINYF